MSKRRRTIGLPRGNHSKRPIDKKIIGIVKTLTDSAQAETTLLTVTFPCTIVGVRWSLSTIQGHIDNDTSFRWAIVVVRDGVVVSPIGGGDGADFYTPEQGVLTWGTGFLSRKDEGSGPIGLQIDGVTKTMRKLQGGDTIKFIGTADQTDGVHVTGGVQFFCKS